MIRQVSSNLKPLVEKPPSQAELFLNQKLEKYLHNTNSIFETEERFKLREHVIKKLHSIIIEWCENIGKLKNLPNDQWKEGGGVQLHIFGSTKLGVNTNFADVDLLCLAPNFISKNDFFLSFAFKLEEITSVKSVTSLPEAYTPVIKFLMDDIEIDMIFVSLPRHVCVPRDIDLQDDEYLDDLDEPSVRSLNGARVAEFIIRLVPDFKAFGITLRAIKFWARQRGIYSNVLGFLGGVNYAILVAYICLLYPKACPAVLIHKFFMVYSNWKWPNPVVLCPIQDRPNHLSSVSGYNSGRYVPVWNSKVNPKDAIHIMPIITPTYPAMNSSYNVGPPQFRAISNEISRGHKICMRSSVSLWSLLFEPIGKEFFKSYPAYVQVDIMAQNEKDHQTWFRWVESRMRTLVLALERPPSIRSHPQANCYHQTITRPSDTKPLTSPPPETAALVSMSSAISMQAVQMIANNESRSQSEKTSNPISVGNMSGSSPNGFGNIVESPSSSTHAPSSSSAALSNKSVELMYISSFFIGLTFYNGGKEFNVTPYIQDILFRIHSWKLRKRGMDLRLSGLVPNDIPPFVFNTPSSPSNVKNCTSKRFETIEYVSDHNQRNDAARSEDDSLTAFNSASGNHDTSDFLENISGEAKLPAVTASDHDILPELTIPIESSINHEHRSESEPDSSYMEPEDNDEIDGCPHRIILSTPSAPTFLGRRGSIPQHTYTPQSLNNSFGQHPSAMLYHMQPPIPVPLPSATRADFAMFRGVNQPMYFYSGHPNPTYFDEIKDDLGNQGNMGQPHILADVTMLPLAMPHHPSPTRLPPQNITFDNAVVDIDPNYNTVTAVYNSPIKPPNANHLFDTNVQSFPENFPLSISPPANPRSSIVQFGDFSPMAITVDPKPRLPVKNDSLNDSSYYNWMAMNQRHDSMDRIMDGHTAFAPGNGNLYQNTNTFPVSNRLPNTFGHQPPVNQPQIAVSPVTAGLSVIGLDVNNISIVPGSELYHMLPGGPEAMDDKSRFRGHSHDVVSTSVLPHGQQQQQHQQNHHQQRSYAIAPQGISRSLEASPLKRSKSDTK